MQAANAAPGAAVKAIEWQQDSLILLDQRLLPHQEHYLKCQSARETADAISNMVVRGAPAIGISAAYGVAMAARDAHRIDPGAWKPQMAQDLAYLRASRPTAVNLFWAMDRMQRSIDAMENDASPFAALLAEAHAIHTEDIAANRRMGQYGADLIAEDSAKPANLDTAKALPGGARPRLNVLTHCNTGSLATGGYGTALGVIRTAYGKGLLNRVYADETRPWLQGSRLTAWELRRDGIPVCLNADGAAAWLMQNKSISWVIVGADRITASGDVANKIGTYSLAILARHHGAKFMVVAPSSTVDMRLASGADIEIEHRSADELVSLAGSALAEKGTEAINPVFDVTPAHLIDAIVTDKGCVMAPNAQRMSALFT